VNPFEIKRLRLKIVFAAVAILLLVALPPVTPHLSIWKVGKIPLSPFQMLYLVLSSEIVLAVYLWGVGNWSRFEPPQIPTGSPAPKLGGPVQPPPTVDTPPVQEQGNLPPQAQKGGN
jgi:hypothetical protein